MNILSLFSGVGGFDLGLEAAGHRTIYQCEWDKHATNILNRHWPDVPKWGDISTLTAAEILSHGTPPDVVAWGSPCQDLSVAGKRAGLAGARSGLFHEGIRIIRELREATDGRYPRISVWENVAGALSSNRGADFGVILNEMAAAGALVQEWRLLDAQYFGVPQRRRRVFLVSVFDPATADRCPDPLLPVSEGVRWHPSTRPTTRQNPPGETATSFGSGDYGGWAETDTAITLSARDHKGTNTVAVESFTGSSHAQYTDGVGTLRANGGDLGGGSETLIAFTKGKRAQTPTDDETCDENRPAPTLNQFDQGDTRATTIVAFSHTQGLSPQPSEQAWPTLRSEGGGHTVVIPIQDGREMEKHQNGLGVAEEGSPAYTLDQTGAQAVAYSIREDATNNNFSATELDRANALSAVRPSPQSHHAQMFITEQPNMAVRRLTPLECERLMGWPDNWTDGQADSHRYKQCGNGVASPVAEWIGHQLHHLNP